MYVKPVLYRTLFIAGVCLLYSGQLCLIANDDTVHFAVLGPAGSLLKKKLYRNLVVVETVGEISSIAKNVT